MGDRLFDRLFGIETAGDVPIDEFGFDRSIGTPYQASNWLNLLNLYRVLRSLRIDRDDVFIDFGCGKGQVLFVAASFPFRRLIGLDISQRLIDIATLNVKRKADRFAQTEVEFVVTDARSYEIPDDVTVCYFYNPFPTEVVSRIAGGIAASAARVPRDISLIYLNLQGPDVLVEHGFRPIRRLRKMTVYSRPAEAPPTGGATVPTGGATVPTGGATFPPERA